MTVKSAQLTEKRAFFRIEDHIALRVERIESGQEARMFEIFPGQRNAFALTNPLGSANQHDLHRLGEIRRHYPAVAAYIANLERRIEQLAQFVAQQYDDFPKQPTHRASIGGGGIRFAHPERVEEGDFLLLRMMLFPSLTRVMALSCALACKPDEEENGEAETPWLVSCEFTHMVEQDRESLIKHIHEQQLRQLRQDHDRG